MLNREIDDANESVLYLINRFRLNTLANNLESRSNDIFIQGLIDETTSSIRDQLRGDHTARDWDEFASSTQMHHKTMLFDLETIAFGSANHTASAMDNSPSSGNQEFLVVIDDFRLARRFHQEYRRLMQKVPEDSDGPTDSFETTPPNPVTNLKAENIEGEGNSLRVTWDPPADPGDFSRYYVFASTDKLSSANQIGDFKDDDSDKYIDEDPVGNQTGFPAGFSVDSQTSCDDDGDGDCDEDPFMFPEAQVKTLDPTADTSAVLDTINYGEQLPNQTDIWVGVVGVDRLGNESDPKFFGPAQSESAIPGADPSFTLDFKEGASKKAGANSTLRIDLHNDASAAEPIKKWTVDFQELNNSFEPKATQAPPNGWSYTVSKPKITYSAKTTGDYISAGETVTFFVNVDNPGVDGESAEIRGTTTDRNNVSIRNILIGTLTIEPKKSEPKGSVAYTTNSEDTRAGRESNATFTISNESGAGADITTITFDAGSQSNSFQFLTANTLPTDWSVDSIGSSSATVSADNTDAEISAGESLDFVFNMRNPSEEGVSDTFTITVDDDQGNTISDTPVGTLNVKASQAIVFNEFMYSPTGTDDDYEWVELFNLNTNSSIDISGWTITVDGETFQVEDGTSVGASGFLVFANDVDDRDGDGKSFSTQYDVSAIQGPAWLLDDDADKMTLTSEDGSYSVTLNYDDGLSSWGTGADETGRTFEKRDPEVRDTGDPATDGDNWRASFDDGGTPVPRTVVPLRITIRLNRRLKLIQLPTGTTQSVRLTLRRSYVSRKLRFVSIS
ncbi:MAG: lamin tail domain-containing protein [bacterium]